MRAVHHFIVHVFDAPAEINFLHVGEEAVVKAAKFVINIGAYEHTSSSCPKHFFDVVVLSVVGFKMLENTSAAERITLFVDETSAGAGIFELILIVVGENFRLASRYRSVAVHQFDDRLNPMRCNLNVRVQQAIILSLNLT